MKFRAIFLTIITVLYLCACQPIEVHKNVFKFWWQEMDCKYPFFIQKNIDWDSIFIAYKEQTQNIQSNKLENVFQEVIDCLKDGHCYINTGQKTIRYELPIDTIDRFSYYDITKYTTIPLKREYNKDSTLYVIQLKSDIIYIHYGSFHFPIISTNEIGNIINRFSYSEGIILDIRNNSGGQAQNIGELLSLFFSGTKTIWYNRHKVGCGHNDFTDFIPQNASGQGIIAENILVAVLTSSKTYSAANYFAGVAKYFPNFALIGTKTGGGGSWTTTSVLPNGWTFTYPVAQAYDMEYNSLESGVEPNIKVTATPEWYANHYDIVLETAYNYLINK